MGRNFNERQISLPPLKGPELSKTGDIEQKAVDTCHGSNPKMCWCTPVVREAIKLKMEAFLVMVTEDSPDSFEVLDSQKSYSSCRGKNLFMGEEAMEKDSLG